MTKMKSNKNKNAKKRNILWASALGLIIILIVLVGFVHVYVMPIELWFSSTEALAVKKDDLEMRVHFIDVGQGDSIMIELPGAERKIMLIDGGEKSNDNRVVDYLKYLKISTIDYLLLTHTDSDHVGGFIQVLDQFEVSSLWTPDISTKVITTATYATFMERSQRLIATTIYTNDNSDILDEQVNCKLDFYVDSDSQQLKIGASAEDKNDVSPYLFLSYANRRFLFTGDATTRNEQKLLLRSEVKKDPLSFDVDVLKVAHHGSNTSTSLEFLQLLQPEYAVISCGLDNRYSHPHAATLRNLCTLMAEEHIYRTDKYGSIVFRVHADGTMTVAQLTGERVRYIIIMAKDIRGAQDKRRYVACQLYSIWTAHC